MNIGTNAVRPDRGGAASASARAAARLTRDPILSRSLNESLARMLRNVDERTFSAGEVIYEANAHAAFLYLLVEGKAKLVGPGKTLVVDGRFGEEAATDVPHYLSAAVAVTDVTVLVLPRASLAGLNQYNPGLKAEFYFALLANFGGERIRAESARSVAAARRRPEWFGVLGWFTCVLLPLVVLLYGPNLGLDRETTVFLAIFTATVVMWAFELVDEYIPGLFAVLTTLALGIVPPRIVLSGFASDGFFMAMSILGLGAVVVMSGLSFRFLLWLLRFLPNTTAGHNFGLLLTGVLLTPLVPSVNGRAALVAPFLIDMVETVKFRFGGRGATRMAVTAFTGVTLLSTAFLTSRAANFVVYGLLPAQEQQQFQFLFWFVAAAATTVVLVAVFWVAAALLFRTDEKPRLVKEQIDVQLELLGNVKNREWAAIAGIVVFAAGVLTTSVHNIQPPWLAMAILYVLLLMGFLRRNEFREKIDWPALVYLGTLVGIVGVFNYLGLDKWLGRQLAPLADVMATDFPLFVGILVAVILAIRLVMPITATMAICATIFMPVAEQVGVNPWVVGFIVLMLGDMWVLPYQCSYYSQFQELVQAKRLYDERSFLRFNMLINVLKVGAVFASIPYWKALGIL